VKTLLTAHVFYGSADATFPFEWKENAPSIADFEHAWPEEIRKLALSRWKEYGFK
jgi:hypothetical protein